MLSRNGGDNMIKRNWAWIVLGLIVGALIWIILFGFPQAMATYIPKTTICHVEVPDEGGVNQQTLSLPIPAALAHLNQHDADYTGECKEEEEISPTPPPTTEPEITQTPTPTPETTPVPTEEVKQDIPPAGHGDGLSDGLGCGSHDCNTTVVIPQKAPKAGGRQY